MPPSADISPDLRRAAARRRHVGRTWRTLRLATIAVALFVASFGDRFALPEAILDGCAVALVLALVGDRLWNGVRALLALVRLRGAAIPERLKARIRGRLALKWLIVGSVLDLVALALLALFLLSHDLFQSIELVKAPVRDMTLFRAGLALTMLSTALEFEWLIARIERLSLTPGRVILGSYVGLALLGTLLLVLPATLEPDASVTLVDAFFVAVSALTVTGLMPIPFTDVYNLLGQTVVMVLIQLGGLGIVTVTAVLALIALRRPSLRHSVVAQEAFGLPAVGELGPFLVKVVLFTLGAEAVGAVVLALTFPAELEGRFFHSVFHAVSAFCNAGFSTFAAGLDLKRAVAFQTTVAFLIVLGGLGFPAIFELRERWRAREVRHRRLSDATALTLRTTAALLIGGFVLILLLEVPRKGLSLAAVGEAAFYSVSARTAGFNVSPMTEITFNAQVIIGLLMVIGGAPLSTAGGIKTTTFAVILLAAESFVRGRSWIQFSRSEVSLVILQRAITIVIVYAGLALGAFLLLALIEPHDNWLLMFETISALSTVGLSIDLTPRLSDASKLVLCFLMVTGRIGIITMVYAGLGELQEQRFRYPKGRIYVG